MIGVSVQRSTRWLMYWKLSIPYRKIFNNPRSRHTDCNPPADMRTLRFSSSRMFREALSRAYASLL